MNIVPLAVGMGIIALVGRVSALQVSVTMDQGSAKVYQYELGIWSSVDEPTDLIPGDSLSVGSGSRARVSLGRQVILLIRGDSRIALGGSESAPEVGLAQGEIFLVHRKPDGFDSISIAARGCTFVPHGTAAAVKITPAGDPTVAVIQGLLKAQSSPERVIDVPAGQYAVYSAGVLRRGKLSESALDQLRLWSGTAMHRTTDFRYYRAASQADHRIDGSEPQSRGPGGLVDSVWGEFAPQPQGK